MNAYGQDYEDYIVIAPPKTMKYERIWINIYLFLAAPSLGGLERNQLRILASDAFQLCSAPYMNTKSRNGRMPLPIDVLDYGYKDR